MMDDEQIINSLNHLAEQKYLRVAGRSMCKHAADRIDALAAKLAEVEAERDQADKLIADVFADAASNNIRLAEAGHRAKAAEAKLAEVEAERDHWETVAIAREVKQQAAEAALLSALGENK